MIMGGIAQGVVVSPYTPDANTLHLWHFDESGGGPVAPAAGVAGSFDLVPDGGKKHAWRISGSGDDPTTRRLGRAACKQVQKGEGQRPPFLN